jgi:hypothetical protein
MTDSAELEKIWNHIADVEEELFYLKSTLGFAKANPPTYDAMLAEF